MPRLAEDSICAGLGYSSQMGDRWATSSLPRQEGFESGYTPIAHTRPMGMSVEVLLWRGEPGAYRLTSKFKSDSMYSCRRSVRKL